jgi:tetratricopeptide (TPR) repeat protein
MLLLRRGLFAESETYFRKALERMTWKNPNPYNSEAYYDLGLSLFYQERYDEAYDAFFKATWSNEQQEMSFYFLAAIAVRRGDLRLALELVEKGLVKNSHNIKARGLKAVILRRLGRTEEAKAWIAENRRVDSFDYVSAYEAILLSGEDTREQTAQLKAQMRNFHQNFILAAIDYMESGSYEEALGILNLCDVSWPMLDSFRGACLYHLGQEEAAKAQIRRADADDPYCCFPNRLEDIAVLALAARLEPQLPKSYYYIGCLWYDKRQYDKAQENWEASAKLDPDYPTVLRNLALVYYNKCHQPEKAKEALERAFALDTTDARIFLELDQLYKKLGRTAEERLEFYETYPDTFVKRDDVYIEYITLLNFTGQHEKAYVLLMGRKFHPWEGGEGKATTQYTTALVELAKKELATQHYEKAKELLEQALIYPENLGEGKLEGTKDNHINYYLGVAEKALGSEAKAEALFAAASTGTDEPAGMMFYNDQPADMIMFQGLALRELQQTTASCSRFYKLISYGEAHIYDEVKMDYFAVSYPDLLIFDENFTKKNQAHCSYLMGLGNLGLGNTEKAAGYFEETLRLDPHHLQAKLYLRGLKAQ